LEKIKIELSEKQQQALKALHWSTDYTHVLYGGAASGGKTFLGCYWQIARRLLYPNTRGLIIRSELKAIRQTTLNTFWQIVGMMKLKDGVDYSFNAQDFVFTFSNGSQIVFKEIQYLPSDPEYSYLGGYECADAFVDEAQQVPGRGLELLGSRIRLNLIGDREQPKPKILMTCNPSKGYLYNEYYDPYRTSKLRPERIFIPALLSDNTLMKNRDVYEETLRSLSERDYKRLALGDWDYDDSPDLLFDTQSMLQMFTNDVEASGDGYITCDPAAMGNDRTVICLWKGLHLIRFFEYNHKYPHEVADIIRVLATENGVRLNNVIVDADGLGIGVAGLLRCKEFNNGSSAKDSVHYSNLKSECYFKLASMVRDNKVYIHDNSKRDELIKELDLVRDRTKEDKKRAVSSKDEIKSKLNRSPDYADAVMMRMFFEVNKSTGKYWYV
jgi:phage terminase large subunit